MREEGRDSRERGDTAALVDLKRAMLTQPGTTAALRALLQLRDQLSSFGRHVAQRLEDSGSLSQSKKPGCGRNGMVAKS